MFGLEGMAVKAVIAAALAACCAAVGWGARAVVADRDIAQLTIEHEKLVSAAEKGRADAERLRAATERAWRADIDAGREEDEARYKRLAALAVKYDSAIRGVPELVSNFTRASGATGDPGTALRDVQARLETLGVLLTERNGMAREAEEYADAATDALITCRRFAEIVSGKKQGVRP